MGRVLVETEVKIRPNFMVAPSVLAAVIGRLTNFSKEDCRFVATRLIAGERWLPGPGVIRPEFHDLTEVSDLTWHCTVVPHYEEIYVQPVHHGLTESDLKKLIAKAAIGDGPAMVDLSGMLVRGELRITQV